MDKLNGVIGVLESSNRDACCWQRNWGYIDGTEQLPGHENAQTRTGFHKKSQRTFSTITMAIDTPQLYLVTSYDQPKDVWDALRKIIMSARH